MKYRTWSIALVLIGCLATAQASSSGPRAGRVRVVGHSLADDGGPFLGLGVSYFTALWRCKNDRPRLDADLAFLSRQGFNSYRMFSMVGFNPSWEGREIAPVSFTDAKGRHVDAWPDYWERFRELVDLAYDRHGMRAQITIFADAQLMPRKNARVEHMRRILEEVVSGREHKIAMLEVANEAWQNGFPGDAGVHGKSRFEGTPGIDRLGHVLRLLPPDLPDWRRYDGKGAETPFTAFAGGKPDRYWPEADSDDGCVRNAGGRKGDRFVCVPIGIRPGGLQVQARQALEFTAHDPLTGKALKTATMRAGERLTLPPGPGALIVLGRILPDAK